MRLEAAIERFMEERRKLGYGALKTHRWMLRRLFLEPVTKRRGEEPLAAELSREDLDAAMAECERRGHSPSTRFSVAGILRVFCQSLFRKGVLLLDPSLNLVIRKPVRRVGFVPSPEQVRLLLGMAEPERVLRREGLHEPATDEEERRRERALAEALRDQAILELLYGSGLRFGELRCLDVRDVQLQERTLFIRCGKWKKDRVVPLTRPSVAALSRYLTEARPALLSQKTARRCWRRRPHRQPLALFLTVTGGRLSWAWCTHVLKPLARLAGLPKGFTAHRLRHACALHLLDAGASVVTIGRLLGHASLQATEVYLHLTTAQLEKALLRAHPREKERRAT